jgi:hypothetical protein
MIKSYILISVRFRCLDESSLAKRRQSQQNGAWERTTAPNKRGADLKRHGAAAYIADILGELKSIANDAGLTFVAYLLAMAKEEAQTAKSPKE